MKQNSLALSALVIISIFIPSCADHDDPQLTPIDTTQVKIKASVKDFPTSSWMNVTEEMTITVSDIEMQAPKGVVLRSVSLTANNGGWISTLNDKPYSGDPLEFKIPLTRLNGRVSFTVIGNLIKKDSRDGKRASKFELGIGATPCILHRHDIKYNGWDLTDVRDGIRLNIFGSLNIGYRLQRKSGFFLRAGLTFLIGDIKCSPFDGLLLIPNISLGYTIR